MSNIPRRMRQRPKVAGRAVPFVNLILPDGTADFTVNELEKELLCHRQRLCILCGQKLDDIGVVISPPEEFESQVFYDSPSHEECILYAVEACPFLANPNYVRTKRNPKGASPEDCSNEFSPEEYLRPAKLALVYLASWEPVWKEFRYYTKGGMIVKVDWETIPTRTPKP